MENLLDIAESICYNTADELLLNNNANKASERIPVMRDMIAGEVCKKLTLDKYLSKGVADAHKSGDIHFHDADYSLLFPQFNCMLINIENMLTNGFNMGNADIETPRSIQTATAITAQIIAQVASHIYGGNSINRIDEVLSPYVRMSYNKHLSTGLQWFDGDERKSAVYATKMTEKETYDAFQSLEYEINTLHTANGQSPFCTVGFGLGTCWESKLIQKSILEVRIKGLGASKRTAVFPKLILTIKDGVNFKQEDPNYNIKQLALECASKRMYPDIINYDKIVEVTGGFKASMGCRSFLGEYKDSSGKEVFDGRNNLGVVSLNLPRVALQAKGCHKSFFSILDKNLSLCKEALEARIKRFEGVQARVAPILYCEGAMGVRLKPDDYVSDLFKGGFSSISLGYIGIHEMCEAMFPDNKESILLEGVKSSFAEEVVTYLSGQTELWKEESGYGYSLYSTPSESLCDRFCRLDEEMFGVVEGVTDKGYYTNSFHLDVRERVAPNTKIDFESKFPKFATGGFISYVELPDMKNHLKGLEWVWDYTYNKLPYFGVNMPVDYCEDCGFVGESIPSENGFACPSCKGTENLQVTRRVCGYLGSPNARPFIKGKQKEVMSRIKHTGD